MCAGLQSDRMAVMAGDDPEPAIVPFRGEYLELAAHERDVVRGLVYPVPDPAYPFLGVHVTRRIDGGADIGPNAVLALAGVPQLWCRVGARNGGLTCKKACLAGDVACH